MYLNVTYEWEFDELMMHLRAKYPKELFNVDGTGDQLDMNKFSKTFFKNDNTTADISIDANANVSDKSVAAYHSELPKSLFKLNSYAMLYKNLRALYSHEIANEIIEKQINGEYYINDMWGLGGAYYYCFNYSAYDVAIKGLPMVDKIVSFPPKHLYSFMNQLLQFSIIASNASVGACGIADTLVVASYYVKRILDNCADAHFEFKDEESCWNYIRETLTSFIYSISQPARGIQAIFSNISLYDDYFLENMVDDYVFPDGMIDIDIVKKVQELYMDIMNTEMRRTPITFPVTTACFSIDENNNIKDDKFLKLISKYNCEFGFMNIFCGDTSVISSCCRLSSDANNQYFNTLGSGGTKIGSLSVCTLNLPRLAYKYKDNISMFKSELKNSVTNISRINNVRRHLVKKRIKNNNYPLYTHGFVDLDKQFSTCGINGLNECLEIFGYDILSDSGIEFGLMMLEIINKENERCAARYKTPHNVELTPSENSSIKLAKKDMILKYNNGEYILYSNQFIPLTTNADMLDRIKLNGIFDSHFGGGSICHINVETQIENPKDIEMLIKTCAEKGVKTFALNYNLQKCKNGHMTVGKQDTCVICGEPIIDNFTRVVGYLSSVNNWNVVRRENDYPNRQFYQ